MKSRALCLEKLQVVYVQLADLNMLIRSDSHLRSEVLERMSSLRPMRHRYRGRRLLVNSQSKGAVLQCSCGLQSLTTAWKTPLQRDGRAAAAASPATVGTPQGSGGIWSYVNSFILRRLTDVSYV